MLLPPALTGWMRLPYPKAAQLRLISTAIPPQPKLPYQLPWPPRPAHAPLPHLSKLTPPRHRLRILTPSFQDPSTGHFLNPALQGARHVASHDGKELFTLIATRTPSAPSSSIAFASLSDAFPPEERSRYAQKRGRESKGDNVWKLRLLFLLRIKTLSRSAVLRKSLRKRWIAALRLIVLHGAKTTLEGEGKPGGLRLDRALADPAKWLLPGEADNGPSYTYVVHPTPHLSAIALPHLVSLVGEALVDVKSQAEKTLQSHSRRPRRGVDVPKRRKA